jgi:hypothetical protein
LSLASVVSSTPQSKQNLVLRNILGRKDYSAYRDRQNVNKHEQKNNRSEGKFSNAATNATGLDQGFVNQVVLSGGELV